MKQEVKCGFKVLSKAGREKMHSKIKREQGQFGEGGNVGFYKCHVQGDSRVFCGNEQGCLERRD